MRYEVIGNHSVDGVAPGGTVELDEDRARYLTRAGHVKAKPAPAKKATKRKKGDG